MFLVVRTTSFFLLFHPILSNEETPYIQGLINSATVYRFDDCSPSSPCGIGEGDCDSDQDCRGRLTCGYSRISGKYGSSSCADYNINPPPLADCCVPSVYSFPVGVPSSRRALSNSSAEDAVIIAGGFLSDPVVLGSSMEVISERGDQLTSR